MRRKGAAVETVEDPVIVVDQDLEAENLVPRIGGLALRTESRGLEIENPNREIVSVPNLKIEVDQEIEETDSDEEVGTKEAAPEIGVEVQAREVVVKTRKALLRRNHVLHLLPNLHSVELLVRHWA